jgi:hypothetical protein
MNTDRRDESYQLEHIVVGAGLDEFAREDGGPDSAPSTFEIVDATIGHTPATAPRRSPATRLRQVMTRTSLAVTTGSRLAMSGLHRAQAATAVVSAAAATVATRAAATARGRLIAFDLPSMVPAPRTAASAVTAVSMAAMAVASLNRPAGSPAAAVTTSASAPVARAVSPADGTTALPIVVSVRAPLTPPVASPRPATVTLAQAVAAPETETVYGGTVGPRVQPVNQPAVVFAIADAAPAEATPVSDAVVAAAVVPAAMASAEVPSPAAAEPAVVERLSRTTPVDTIAADRSAIEGVLSSYRRSYNALDARAVSAIWQGVDSRALARAFSTLTRQHIMFERCDVRVAAADRAAARCHGILSYVQKAGDTSPQQRRVSWDIDLKRPGGTWVIVGVQAR